MFEPFPKKTSPEKDQSVNKTDYFLLFNLASLSRSLNFSNSCLRLGSATRIVIEASAGSTVPTIAGAASAGCAVGGEAEEFASTVAQQSSVESGSSTPNQSCVGVSSGGIGDAETKLLMAYYKRWSIHSSWLA